MVFFFFNDTATTEIYTLSLHDALPILVLGAVDQLDDAVVAQLQALGQLADRRPLPVRETLEREQQLVLLRGQPVAAHRSEEHTSELQSRQYLVCRLLLEKKKNKITISV